MTLQQRRIKVLEKLLDDTLTEVLAIEVGMDIKEAMLLMVPNHPQAAQIEQAIQKSKLAIADQQRAAEIMQAKLEEELKNAA